MKKFFPAALLIAGLITGSAHAATINWGSAADIAGDSDVSTLGAPVAAYTGHTGTGNITVNGVTFNEGVIPGFNASGNLGASRATTSFTSGSYYDLLQTNSYGLFTTTSTVTLSGLTPGQAYLVQAFVVDTNGTDASNNRIMRLDSNGNTVDVDDFGGLDNGQYVTGTFTADAASQSFTVTHYENDGVATGPFPTLNALQLRAIPEPGSLALLGLGGLLIARRRRG